MDTAPIAPKVLVVDDEEILRSTFAKMLSSGGFDVTVAADFEEARAALGEKEFDVALIDRILGNGPDGIDVIKQVRDTHRFCQCILISGVPSFESAAETLRYDAFAYITKPVHRDDLLRVAKDAARENRKRKSASVQKALFHSIFDLSPNPIAVCDLSGWAVFINPVFEKTFGFTREEVLGKEIPFVPPDDKEKTRQEFQALREGRSVPERETLRTDKDGRGRNVTTSLCLCRDSHDEPTGILVILRDITETKQMEQQLRETDKMSVLGQLASKLAHEISNPAQIITGYTELLLDCDPLPEDTRDIIAAIHESALQITRLNRDLSEVASPRALRIADFNPQTPLEDAITFMKEMGEIKHCRIEKDFHQNVPDIRGDPSQLQHVFINLIQNASQAMVEAPEPVLSFQIRADGKADRIEISISDNGCGIPAEKLEIICRSIETAPTSGSVAGLGLPIVKSIVDRHGGTIRVDSRAGRGTTFTISLPGSKPGG